MQLKVYIIIFGCILLFNGYNQVNDTLRVIEVHSKKDSIIKITVINSNVPHYILDKNKLNELSADDIGEALKFIPGTYIKDYGGIGGLKTVSYRSLGAAHSGIEIDGVILPNTQTATVNLSDFDVFSISRLEMTSGQVQNHFSTASSYVKANILSIISNLFIIPTNKTEINILSSFSSINSFQNGLSFQEKIGKHVSFGLQGLYSFGSGEYPFTIQNIDSTYSDNRQNSNLFNLKIKGAINYQKNNLKIHFNSSYHNDYQNLPGAVVLYNPYNDQNLANKKFNSSFIARVKTKRYALGFNAFLQKSETIYRDNQFLNLLGYLENTYNNQSIGGGFIYSRFIKTETQKVFIGSDIKTSTLTGEQFTNSPERTNISSVFGVSKWFSRIKIQGNISHQMILDYTPTSSTNLSHFSPFFSLAYLPFKEYNFRLRSHYKNTYRLPSFNDLYYNTIGNSNLKAENASSYNLGITYGNRAKSITTETTIDIYNNFIKDKIVAIPTKNLFNWSMQNIGNVLSQGIDVNFLISFKKKNYSINFTTSQSINKSIDITNKTSTTYGHQIPYTPIYTASYAATVGYKKTNLTTTVLHSGSRYTLNENLPFNLLNGFIDLGIGLNRIFKLKNQKIYINFQVANIFNKNYEVIKSFPMPGRFIKLKLIYSISK
jgi:vitamin B12 transporter